MEKDDIDASLGLAFSLVVFERYRRSGIVQAELHHVPGLRGKCMGFLHLVEGKVTACSVEDKQGQRFPINKDVLVRLDSEKGPFEWKLHPFAVSKSVHVEHSSRLESPSPRPRRSGPLELEKLDGWSYRQKMMLSIVYELIDGQRSIDDLKGDAPLPPNIVDEAVQMLIALNAITVA